MIHIVSSTQLCMTTVMRRYLTPDPTPDPTNPNPKPDLANIKPDSADVMPDPAPTPMPNPADPMPTPNPTNPTPEPDPDPKSMLVLDRYLICARSKCSGMGNQRRARMERLLLRKS